MGAEEIEKRWCDRCGKRVKEDAQIDDTGQLLCAAVSYTHLTLPTTPYV